MAEELGHELAGVRLPHPDRQVVAPGRDPPPVGAPRDRVDRAVVPSQLEEQVAGAHVVDRRLVDAPERHDDPITSGAQRRIHREGVEHFDRADHAPGGRIRDPDDVLERPARRHQRSVGVERDTADFRIARHARDRFAGGRVPHPEGVVVARRREHRAVGRERDVVDVDVVPLEGGERGFPGLGVADVDHLALLGTFRDEHAPRAPVERPAEIGDGELDPRRRHRPMERFLRLGQDLAVDGARLLDRLERQQHAPFRVDVEVGDGRRGELARDRDPTCRLRASPLGHREHGQADGDEGGRGEDGDDGAEPADRPALQVAFVRDTGVLVLPRRVQVLALLGRDGDAGAGLPRLGLLEPGAAEQERGIAVGLDPLARGRGDPPLRAQILPSRVDPPVQPRPRREHRLVRQLDRGHARAGVPVERELPRGSERVEDRRHRLLVDVERGDLRARHPSPRVLGPLPECDEPEEQLTSGLLPVVIELRVELLRPPAERTRDPADLPVGLEEEDPPVPALEQLGQGVLHQRERAGLLGDIGEHRGDQAGLERHIHTLRRARDRAFELLGRERDHGLHTGLEQLREAPVEERPVVEVGAEGDDHAEPAAGVGRRRLEALEEVRPDRLVLDQREDLLELVDHEDEVRSVGGEQSQDRPVETVPVTLQLLHQARGWIRGGAEQRGFQPVERVRAGEHVRDAPSLGAGDRAAAQRGDQPGAHDRGLAAPARADHREEPRLPQPLDELLDQLVASEEVGRVAFLERTEALVRVRDDRTGDRRCETRPPSPRAPAGTPCRRRRRSPRPGAGPHGPGRRGP